MTSAVSPACSRDRRMSWTATAKGSTIAATSIAVPSGSLCRVKAGTTQVPCIAPSVSSPRNFRLWQICAFPASQAGHLPAGVQRADDDRVTDGHAGHPVAQGRNPARHLVPDDPVLADTGVHVAVEDVHIGAADADEGDIHRHLARSGFARCDGLDGEVPPPR